VSGIKNKKVQHSPQGAPHLGGHNWRTHIDTSVLDYFKKQGAKSFLDIGCGLGGMVIEAINRDYDAIGIDGDFRLERSNPEHFILQDFTKGPAEINRNFDLGWSCEFVEHVEQKYLDNFMKAFALCNTVVMTYAPVGKEGHHHVNCNTQEYWIDMFKDYGFTYNDKLTQTIRSNSNMRKGFVRNYGLCFDK
jgi:cyclopropane fatty-acyl-phospholipid synthase-like methyltransferase